VRGKVDVFGTLHEEHNMFNISNGTSQSWPDKEGKHDRKCGENLRDCHHELTDQYFPGSNPSGMKGTSHNIYLKVFQMNLSG